MRRQCRIPRTNMGIRSFHIFFILTSLALMGFIVSWSRHHLAHGHGDHWTPVIAAVAILGLLSGIPYLIWFIRKTKSL